jgi:hypothetical protein
MVINHMKNTIDSLLNELQTERQNLQAEKQRRSRDRTTHFGEGMAGIE